MTAALDALEAGTITEQPAFVGVLTSELLTISDYDQFSHDATNVSVIRAGNLLMHELGQLTTWVPGSIAIGSLPTLTRINGVKYEAVFIKGAA